MTPAPVNITRATTGASRLTHRLMRVALSLLVILFALQGLQRCGRSTRDIRDTDDTAAQFPADAVIVDSPVQGVLAGLHATEGSVVTNHQVIAVIWPAEHDVAVAQARRALEAARVEFQQARLQLDSARLDSQRETQRTRMRIMAMEGQHRSQIELQSHTIEDLESQLSELQAAGPRGTANQERTDRIAQLTGRIDLLEADIERRLRLLDGFGASGANRPDDLRLEDLETAARMAEDRMTRHEAQFAEAQIQREAATVTVKAPVAGRVFQLPHQVGAPLRATAVIAVIIARENPAN